MPSFPQTVEGFRDAARRRLPRAIFDTIEGGAGQEQAIARNAEALRECTITPRVLAGGGTIDTTVQLLGQPASCPLILAPTGLSGLYRPEGERLVAAAAEPLIYALSCMSSVTLEEVAGAAPGRKWFQLYPFRSRVVMADLIERARTARYEALCVTVDVPALGVRYRDLRSGVRLARPTAGLMLAAALHPAWAWPYLTGFRPGLANMRLHADGSRERWLPLSTPELDPAFGWADLQWVKSEWQGPLIVKGILHPDDAGRAFAAGASAIVVSNHGGRQLDSAPSTLAALRLIREALGPNPEIYADGGIMTGEDILKYLLAGADACLVGRAYLYGLAAGGAAGVQAVITILRRELELAMRLAGIGSVGRAVRAPSRSRR